MKASMTFRCGSGSVYPGVEAVVGCFSEASGWCEGVQVGSTSRKGMESLNRSTTISSFKERASSSWNLDRVHGVSWA